MTEEDKEGSEPSEDKFEFLERVAQANLSCRHPFRNSPREVEDAILVDSGNHSELSRAIDRLLNDRMLRVRITASARRTVEMRYSFAVRMERVRELYDRLLGRKI